MARRRDISGMTALVTGAAGGIGLEFAKVLAKRGCNLILLDIDDTRLTAAREDILSINAVDVHLLKINLTSENFIDRVENFCHESGLMPEILINNAGIFSFKPIADTATGKIEAFINLHIRAVTLLSQWFVSKRKDSGKGWMLNMSSMSCWMPMPGLAMYSSTKSYIRVFTRALHYEMKEFGVGVTVACPGGIATDLFGLPKKWQKFAVAIGVLQTPQAFTKRAVDKMLKKKKQYINGWLNRFSIFFVGILPTSVRMMVKHHLLDKGITR